MYKRQIDIEEENRIARLDHFEENEMIPFVQNIADAMFSDIPTVLSLVHFASQNYFCEWKQYTDSGRLVWGGSRGFGTRGKTPIEILYSLYRFPIYGRYENDQWITDFPKLAKCLFYNHEANRL